MASKTDIVNRAFSKLGQTRVSNIDNDTTANAIAMKDMYEIIRDDMLTAYPWNFAVTRTQLAKDATVPAWGYDNRYTLPSDFLALLEIKDNPQYTLETDKTSGGRYILTDAGSPIYIKYIKRVTNTGEFDPLFVEAFATRLAYEGCEFITQSNTKKDLLFRDLQVSIERAYASDAIQETPVFRQEDSWIVIRNQDSDDIDYNA